MAISGDPNYGAIMSWKRFTFPDGEMSDKLLVILGARPGRDIISVLTTSRYFRPLELGCNLNEEIYFIHGGGKNFFGWTRSFSSTVRKLLAGQR
jgi:hypothetical protein